MYLGARSIDRLNLLVERARSFVGLARYALSVLYVGPAVVVPQLQQALPLNQITGFGF
jgi:hypothetical protein